MNCYACHERPGELYRGVLRLKDREMAGRDVDVIVPVCDRCYKVYRGQVLIPVPVALIRKKDE